MSSKSDRKSGESERLTIENREVPFATIVEKINDGILLCELSGKISYANEAMATMLGYTREEMVEKQLFDFMSPEWAERARENLRRREEGVEEMFDHQFEHRNGTGVWALVSAKPMLDDDGVQWGSLVAIQDISTRKQMEEELRQAREELEQRVQERTEELTRTNARLQTEVEERRVAEEQARKASQAKSAFLANMSHELRTPLNAVLGYTELIQEELSLQDQAPEEELIEDIEKDLAKIHRAAAHLLTLINDVLDLSKVEAGRMSLHLEEIALDGLIEEVLETMDGLVRENGNSIRADQDLPIHLMTDRTKLKQILLNLVGNAAKFTEEGHIEIRSRISDEQQGSFVRIDITDTGMGIAENQVERLFEPFTQADESMTRKHGGTGLGLTICKRFCEMMGGRIEVDTAPGSGSTFSVFLPLDQEVGLGESSRVETGPASLPYFESKSASSTELKMLIIDDDPAAHDLMRRFLTPRNYQVFSAFHGAQGIHLARTLKPDVIVLDVMMPGQDGWSVLTHLKGDAQLQEIPVVMVTMVDDQSIAYALGAANFVRKPVQREKILEIMETTQSFSINA